MTAPAEPTPIAPGPAVPTSTDPEATFDAQFEAFLAWQKNELQPGINALATNVFDNATEARAAAIATAADLEQTGLDKVATAADRVQTGLDRTQTGLDRVQTGLDKVATAADRVQTGLDAITATTQATQAAASAAAASAVVLGVSTAYPAVRPTMLANFKNSRMVSSRVSVSRATPAAYWDEQGRRLSAAAGVGRINFDPATGRCLGLQRERGATNVCLHSDDFTQAEWVKSGVTITAGPTLAHGTVPTLKLVESAANEPHNAVQAIALTAGTRYALSCEVLAGERSRCRIAGAVSTNWSVFPAAVVNLAAGTIESSTGDKPATIEHLGAGLYRVTIFGTPTAISTGVTLHPLGATGTTSTYAGDGTSGIYCAGVQVEAGNSATSKITTAGSAVTRSADLIRWVGADFSWWRAVGGTVEIAYSVAERPLAGGGFVTAIYNPATPSNDYLGMSYVTATSDVGPTYWRRGGAGVIGPLPANVIARNQTMKYAAAFSGLNLRVALNGSSLSPAVSAAALPDCTEASLMSVGSANNFAVTGHIESIAFYAADLATSEMNATTAP